MERTRETDLQLKAAILEEEISRLECQIAQAALRPGGVKRPGLSVSTRIGEYLGTEGSLIDARWGWLEADNFPVAIRDYVLGELHASPFWVTVSLPEANLIEYNLRELLTPPFRPLRELAAKHAQMSREENSIYLYTFSWPVANKTRVSRPQKLECLHIMLSCWYLRDMHTCGCKGARKRCA